MSRPTASVPNMCAPNNHSGGFSAKLRFCAFGSKGAIQGASAPVIMRASTMTLPTVILGFSNGRTAAKRRLLRGGCCSASTKAKSTVELLFKANPRIDDPIEDVDDEIDCHEGQRIDDDRSGDERIVARLDRRDQQRAAARPGEYGLDDDR